MSRLSQERNLPGQSYHQNNHKSALCWAAASQVNCSLPLLSMGNSANLHSNVQVWSKANAYSHLSAYKARRLFQDRYHSLPTTLILESSACCLGERPEHQLCQSLNALISQKKKVSKANRATGEGSLWTAQPNCSNNHQFTEASQRLRRMKTALKGLKKPEIPSFYEMLLKSHKKETGLDWTFLHFRPTLHSSLPRNSKLSAEVNYV